MRWSASKATRHIRRLARGLGASVVLGTSRSIEWYSPNDHTVYLRPILSLRGYYACLHELGHAAGRTRRRCHDEEWRAWAWARRHALWLPTQGVERMIARCLSKYASFVPVGTPTEGTA